MNQRFDGSNNGGLGLWMPNDYNSLEDYKIKAGVASPPEAEKEAPLAHIYAGIDLGGRSRDPSAMAVVYVYENALYEKRFEVKYLKRFPLLTRYTGVAREVGKIDGRIRAQAAKEGKIASIMYIVDSTGLGDPIAELIEHELPEPNLFRCWLTAGRDPNEVKGERVIHLPKQIMVSNLIRLFDSEAIKIAAKSGEISAMVSELETFEMRVSEKGTDKYGAFKTGAHDDLCCALGLACYLGGIYGAPAKVVW